MQYLPVIQSVSNGFSASFFLQKTVIWDFDISFSGPFLHFIFTDHFQNKQFSGFHFDRCFQVFEFDFLSGQNFDLLHLRRQVNVFDACAQCRKTE